MTLKTIEQAIAAASQCLEGVGVENPRMESEFLISALLRMPRTRLFMQRHETLPLQTIKALRMWLRERQKRKPLAYVTGEQPFRDLTLHVTRAVLIPRPETELLVEQATRILEKAMKKATVVDVGTGSGAIALSLCTHPHVLSVLAVDRSAAALQVAKANECHVEEGVPVHWIHGNLLAPLKKKKVRADLIVANLPYVRTEEMADLEPELQWEPRMALDGGDDGLRLIEPCIGQAFDILHPGGTLLLEIGADQSRAVISILQRNAGWTGIQVFRDLAGLPRIVQSQKGVSHG